MVVRTGSTTTPTVSVCRTGAVGAANGAIGGT